MTLAEILAERRTTPDAALAAFDALPPATPDDLIGHWRGHGIATGHRLDGVLEATGWYGKLFIDAETVHPLLFYGPNRRSVRAIDPRRLPLTLPLPASAGLLRVLMLAAMPLLATNQPRARVRSMQFRAFQTASMVYDHQPIFDHFARIDDRRLLGIMDFRADPAPFVFVLERDTTPIPIRLRPGA